MPCEMELVCNNSPFIAGEVGAMCSVCRLSPEGRAISSPTHHWSPTKAAKKSNNVRMIKHPVLEQEKLQAKIKLHKKRIEIRKNRDKGRIKVAAQSARAERSTEKKIIQATKNSGRVNRDGDHVVQGFVTLDTKQQSTRTNPVVLLSELNKVREDADRSGKYIGALVLRNKFDIGVLVMLESDFAKLNHRIVTTEIQEE